MAGELLLSRVALVTGGTADRPAAAIGLAAAVARSPCRSPARRRRDHGPPHQCRRREGTPRAVRSGEALEIEQMVERVLELSGSLDSAYNNAGILGEMNVIADETLGNYEHVFNTNVLAPCCA